MREGKAGCFEVIAGKSLLAFTRGVVSRVPLLTSADGGVTPGIKRSPIAQSLSPEFSTLHHHLMVYDTLGLDHTWYEVADSA